MESFKVMCIDDDRDFLIGLKMQLKGIFALACANSVAEGLSIMEKNPTDLILLDVGLGKENGIEAIKKLKSIYPLVDIVMVSGHRDPKTVVDSVRAGATDYLTKPVDMTSLEAVAERTLASQRLRERYEAIVEAQNDSGPRKEIIHRSEVVKEVLRQAEQVKGHGANVLIVGETGTGKELLARYVHKLEGGAGRPFIAVNCAAIPEHLLEAELFGAEAGSYTGAVKRRIGKFEIADGGDIFLDEITSLKLELQAKILRVIQEHEFSRLGGNEVIKTNFRLIAAANTPLEEKVSRGEFRMDLYHRIRVIQLAMPPLRERTEDIPALVEFFLRKFTKDGLVKTISDGAMSRLMVYHWPGNVRELANVIQSLTILATGDVIDESVFPPWALNGCRPGNSPSMAVPILEMEPETFKDYVSRAERQFISHILQTCDGDKSKAARTLGLGRTTLYIKMKELGLM